MTDEWKPPRSATELDRADERVAFALREENGYWQSEECRRQIIAQRVRRAWGSW